MIILVFLIIAIALGVVLGRLLWKALPVIAVVLVIGYVGSHWNDKPVHVPNPAEHAAVTPVYPHDDDDTSVQHAKAICAGDKDPQSCESAAEFSDMLDKIGARK